MFKRSSRIILVVALIIGVFNLIGCGSTAPAATDSTNTSTQPVASKILKVGGDLTYAPFGFMDQAQKPVGFDIDLMDAIAKDMGYTAKYESSPFDGLALSLDSGKYDAVISAMSTTPERAKTVLFSNKYFVSVQYIAVKQGSSIKSANDLKGKRVGVQVNTTPQTSVEALGITPKKYDTTPDAMTDLMNGGLDAVVADGPVVLYFMKENPQANIVAIQGDSAKEDICIAMKLDNKELATKINASLEKLMNDGKYNEIYKKWFNTDAPKLD